MEPLCPPLPSYLPYLRKVNHFLHLQKGLNLHFSRGLNLHFSLSYNCDVIDDVMGSSPHMYTTTVTLQKVSTQS